MLQKFPLPPSFAAFLIDPVSKKSPGAKFEPIFDSDIFRFYIFVPFIFGRLLAASIKK
jgi:hypothetical protein